MRHVSAMGTRFEIVREDDLKPWETTVLKRSGSGLRQRIAEVRWSGLEYSREFESQLKLGIRLSRRFPGNSRRRTIG